MATVNFLARLLVIVGGLNWGLVGGFDFNLVNALVGGWPMVENAVYVLVGLAALYEAYNWCVSCQKK